MGALLEFGTLLRLALGTSAVAVARYLDTLAPGAPGASAQSQEDPAACAASAARLCRHEIANARAERERLVAKILLYERVHAYLIARAATAADPDDRKGQRRSIETLESRLTGWLDEHDAIGARIAELEADLAFFETAADPRKGDASGYEAGGGGAGRDEGEYEAPQDPVRDAAVARHLSALGLAAMPASLPELKSAYRSRLKAVHPDVSGQASTEEAARATVAFAELRRRLVRT